MTEKDNKKHVTPDMKLKAIKYYLENNISEKKLAEIKRIYLET